ncbi:MAG: hypothetical protein U9N73_09295 [Candidatus Auribacterota bacterium]|nr:hypothetical protein [Candidatus Auribacterota bacterium]
MNRLPEFLKKYFWDTEFEDIILGNRRVYVLRRILEYGDEKAVAWMRKNFTTAEMKNALSNYRGYSQKSANYWALLLDMPREKILCLKRRSSKEQKKIWPY